MKTTSNTNPIRQSTGSFVSLGCVAIALLAMASQFASAQSGVWTNQANGNWSAAVNWKTGAIASGQDSTADFASVTWTNGHQTTLDAPYTVGTLKFGNANNAANTNCLIGANTLTLQTSTGNPTITASNQNAVVGVPLASSEQVLISGNVVAITNAANNNGQTGGWILQAGQAGFLGQSALGSGSVTIGSTVGGGLTGFNMIDTAAAGAAPVVLTNNFTIQTIRWIAGQSGCTFNAQPVTILGNVFLNSGTANVRDIAIANTLTLGGVVSGGGNYGVIIGALGGTLNLTNSGNTFYPAVTLNVAGTIGANADGALGAYNNPIKFTSAGGTFRALASFATSNYRQLVFTAAGSIDTSTNGLEVDGAITGAGTITKNGTGTLNLTGANTFSGGVTLNAGTLEVSSSGSLATSAGFTMLTNTVLLLQDFASLPNAASYTVNNGGKFVLAGWPTIKATAPITVNAGGLLDASALSSPLTLNSGQILSGSGVVTGVVYCASGAILVPGTAGTAGTLTFDNDLNLSAQTIQFDLNTNTVEGGGTNDEIIVAGNLNLSGGEKVLLNYINGSLAAGTYKLIKFGGTLTGNFALATSYPNVTIDNGVGTPGYVTLVVSATSIAQNLIWQGDGAANLWDISTTPNWVAVLGGSTLDYNDPSKVTFNDFGSNNVPVTLNTVVYPNAVTFNITNHAYALLGSGKISGPVAVTINGGNALTNGLANDYAGGTVINGASTLVLLDGSAPGSGGVQLNATTGSVIANNSSALNLPNRIWGNAVNPTFVQNGPGTTTLANTADNSGLAATVNAGTLQLAAASTSGLHALGGNSKINNGGTLQLGGAGGDQIYNAVVVTDAGGTFDGNGQSETFKSLNGYGSILDSVGGATLTLTNAPGINVTGGIMNANVNLTLGSGALGFQVQSGATLNLLGGTLTYGSSTAGTVQGGGVFNMSGGAFNETSTYLALGGGAGTAIANFSGGTFTQPGEFLQFYGGGSIVTVSSNAVMHCHYWSYGDQHPGTNYFNGGLTRTDTFHQRGAVGWSAYFNGGTIQANSTQAHFLPDAFPPNSQVSQHAYISTNGAIFDTQTYSISIGQNLEHDPSLGAGLDGGLTKLGSGTLTLTGNNTFNGSLTNNAGTLVFNNNGSYNNLFIADNATNQVNLVAAGTSLTNSTLTIGSSGTGTQGLNFNLGSLGTPTAPLITVNGSVTNSGNVLVTLIAPVLSPGTIPLLQYGSMNAANFAGTWAINPYPYVSLTLTNDTVHKLVSIIVVPGVTPKWKGNLGNEWDTTTFNWLSNGIAATYNEATPPGEPVTFDDTALNFTVDISTVGVNPLFINMTNNNNNYTITGTLGIGGTGALIKSGAGALVLSNTSSANTYSGITTVNGGSLVVGAANLLSPNSAMTFNNSTLNLSSNSQAFGSITLNNSALVANNCTLTGSGGSLNINDSGNFTLGPVLAGTIGVNITGTGETTIANNNPRAGVTTIYSGSIRVQNGAGLGPGGFNGNNTLIQPGGRLILDGSFTIPESIQMNGTGPDGAGALMVTNGSVVENGSPCQISTPTTMYISAGSSMEFEGQAGGNAATLYGGVGTLTKSGLGDLLVGGLPANACTVTPVVVAQGRFIATNCNTTGFITVNNGATLAGNGPFNGGINILEGGNLTPNLYGTIETLTSSAGLTNAGAMTLQLLKTATTTNADQISCSGYFTNSGTLTVITNVGSTLALAAGDSFKLFTLTNYSALTGLIPTLPVLPTGLGWTNTLAVNGTVSVVATVSTTPFSLGTSVSGNHLTLTWPADHTGWRLQTQTNSLSGGTWYDVPGATSVDTETINVDPAEGAVFYRMVYP